ncbi:MAG: IPTL-CTERM sorting domain-containing protein [Phycisphaerae bacterium]
MGRCRQHRRRPAIRGLQRPDGIPGTADDDLRLLSGSPCIDAANNAAVPPDVPDLDGDGGTFEPLPFDLDGNPRFVDDPETVDTGIGTPPIVDMGAYEFQEGCGNGIVEANEECDDGNINQHDSCLRDCVLNVCGDGFHNVGIEECDDAGESASCDADCTLPICGDGIVNAAAFEQCDNGPDDPSDCCLSICFFASSGSLCGQGPTECSDQGICDGGGNCNANDAPAGSPCGAPADMPGSCFTGDACSGGGVCLPGSIVTACIDDDLCCNRDQGCNAGNDNDCEADVPTVSTWGLLVLALLLAATAKVQFGRRRLVQPNAG